VMLAAGVTFAEAGSTICGEGACAPGSRCFDGEHHSSCSQTHADTQQVAATSSLKHNLVSKQLSCTCSIFLGWLHMHSSAVQQLVACTPAYEPALHSPHTGWNCCPENVQVCGGVCCDNNRVCLMSQCVAQGSIPCGSAVCQNGQTCNNGVCCSADRVVCGSTCCDSGQQCINGQCAATGSTACGASVCDPTQTCSSGICCPAGQVSSQHVGGIEATLLRGTSCATDNNAQGGHHGLPAGLHVFPRFAHSMLVALHAVVWCLCQLPALTTQCAADAQQLSAHKPLLPPACQVNCAGKCCGGGNTCLQGQFCVPLGSTVCGSTVCQSPQQCAGGAVCCDPGASFCAGAAWSVLHHTRVLAHTLTACCSTLSAAAAPSLHFSPFIADMHPLQQIRYYCSGYMRRACSERVPSTQLACTR
jgi:hypothetical protein